MRGNGRQTDPPCKPKGALKRGYPPGWGAERDPPQCLPTKSHQKIKPELQNKIKNQTELHIDVC